MGKKKDKKKKKQESDDFSFSAENLSARGLTGEYQQDQGVAAKSEFSMMLSERKKNLCRLFKGEHFDTTGETEQDLERYHWEYVIVLKNPDFFVASNEEVTRRIAEKLFRNAFRKKKFKNPHLENLQYNEELQAFIQAFESLSPHLEGKKKFGGGRFIIEQGEVVDTQIPIMDFSSLIRNVILYKLVGHLGLKVKQLLSVSGEHIYLLITADVEDLKIEAERVRFSKQLEISLTDMISLLPCDKALRPLHLLLSPSPEIDLLFKKVKSFYNKLFESNSDIEKYSFKYEAQGMTITSWKAYEKFLELLKIGIDLIKSTVKSKHNKYFMFKKIIKDSLEKANMGLSRKDKLKTMWERLHIKPCPPYAEFRRGNKEDELSSLWRLHETDESGERSLFKSMDRIRLLSTYLETALDLNLLELKGYVAGHFPLHNKYQIKGRSVIIPANNELEEVQMKNAIQGLKPFNYETHLLKLWKTSLFFQQIPLSKIRNYFGEKIALYFEFLRTYQVYLLLPGILGLIVFNLQQYYPENSQIVMSMNIVYSIFMAIWSTVFLENWNRREASLAIIWGQTSFEQIEVPRGKFKGEPRRSPVTDQMDEVHFEESKRRRYFMLSIVVTMCIIATVLSIVAGLVLVREHYRNDYATYGTAIANAIQILIFNVIYTKLAKYLTDLENHKTQVKYENSLIVKTFVFQFVNAFNSLFYIAFFKSSRIGCYALVEGEVVKTSCMKELYIQLLMIFAISYLKNLAEIGVPYIMLHINKSKKNSSSERGRFSESKIDLRSKIYSQFCKDYYLNRDIDCSLDDYLELAIQYGYVSLFAIAFPLSSTLAFIGLWLEMLTDKTKIIKLVRRPVPFAAKDIGTWKSIFSGVSVIAIFTNTALFCFTAETFTTKESMSNKDVVVFGCVVILLLMFRGQIQLWIPDVPENYEIVQARHEYVVSRVLRGKESQEIDEEVERFDSRMYFVKLKGN